MELITMSFIVRSAHWGDVVLFSILVFFYAARIDVVHIDVLVNISLALICI